MRRSGFALLLLFSLTALGQNVPIPFIDQPLSPTTLPPGSQGFTLTVHGANFAPSAVLEWDGKQRTTSVFSSALLQATINTSDLAKPGTASVTVVNLATNPKTSNTALFTIRKPAPAVAFAPDPNFSGSGISSVAGDFNGDGKPDVTTCNVAVGGSLITVYLGAGQGKFQPPIKSSFAGMGVRCGSMFIGDFNGDHLLDLAVSHSKEVSILFGDGKGKFTKGPITQLGGPVYAVADVNGDGNLDLLITAGRTSFQKGAFVVFGNGDGTFAGGTKLPAVRPGFPVLGDFNEDGKLDFAVPDLFDGTIHLPFGDFPLAFSTGIATADVNGDGHLDIVSDFAAVLLGKGDGTFSNGEGGTFGSSTPIIADFNGDGKQDLLLLSNPLSIMLGNGDGTFQPPALAAGVGLNPLDVVTLADFNHDGHIDLVGGGGVFWQISAGLSPAALSYAPQNVGTSSPPQTANLYNAGSTTLNLTNIRIGGTNSKDYSQTNNCPSSIPVGGGCQIQIVFTPTAVGNRLAKLIVTYAGFGSPQSVTLAGQGVGTISVSLTPSNLPFPKQLLNTTSTPQAATLTNTGTNDVMISSIGTSGLPFAETNNCPSTLPAGKSCQIQVTFAPTQNGPASGMLSVSDSAPDSPQTVALSGTGTSVAFKPIGVNFGDQKVGTKGAPVPITFTNKGTVALNISQIAFGGTNPGDFSETNDCPSSLPAGNSCAIQVTFKPTQKGSRSAALQVSDDANPSPQQSHIG